MLHLSDSTGIMVSWTTAGTAYKSVYLDEGVRAEVLGSQAALLMNLKFDQTFHIDW